MHVEIERVLALIGALKPNLADTYKLITNPKSLEVDMGSIGVFLKRFGT